MNKSETKLNNLFVDAHFTAVVVTSGELTDQRGGGIVAYFRPICFTAQFKPSLV